VAGILTRLSAAYLKSGLPMTAHLDLTYRCPLRCRLCYARGQSTQELSARQWTRVLEDLRDLSVLTLTLSGGEVFARRDFLDILDAAVRLSFLVTVKSSLASASRPRLRRLARIRPAMVDVSFYSHRPEVHDAVTGVPGSFEKTLAAVRFLQDSEVRVDAVVTLLKGFEEDPAAFKSGLHRQGVRSVMFNTVSDALCERVDVSDLLVSDRVLEEQWAAAASGLDPGTAPPRPKPSTVVCSAAVGSLFIGPDGTVTPCVRVLEPAGNVLATPLSEIWRDSEVLRRFRSVRWKHLDQGRCLRCEHSPYCSYCFGISLSDTGSPLLPSEETCRIARATHAGLDTLRRRAGRT
jgi:radical SAM protein with 4Fe4S-binding SPASM domain